VKRVGGLTGVLCLVREGGVLRGVRALVFEDLVAWKGWYGCFQYESFHELTSLVYFGLHCLA
jgi:hypothetical protein